MTSTDTVTPSDFEALRRRVRDLELTQRQPIAEGEHDMTIRRVEFVDDGDRLVLDCAIGAPGWDGLLDPDRGKRLTITLDIEPGDAGVMARFFRATEALGLTVKHFFAMDPTNEQIAEALTGESFVGLVAGAWPHEKITRVNGAAL